MIRIKLLNGKQKTCKHCKRYRETKRAIIGNYNCQNCNNRICKIGNILICDY